MNYSLRKRNEMDLKLLVLTKHEFSMQSTQGLLYEYEDGYSEERGAPIIFMTFLPSLKCLFRLNLGTKKVMTVILLN